MGKRVLILSAGAGSGHNSAARALEAALRERPDVDAVETWDVLDYTTDLYSSFYSDVYFDLVKAVPWLVGWGYDLNDQPFRSRNTLTLLDQLTMSKAAMLIRDFAPDVALCTHFLPAKLMSLLIARDQLPTSLGIITTDYDFQALWFSNPFSHYFVARDETRAYMRSIGLPDDRVSVSGIPVKPEFAGPVDRAAVLARYDLSPDLPLLLISAGAAGGDYALDVVAQVLQVQQPCQAVIISGRNEELRKQAASLVNAAPQARRDHFRVLGYTDEMAALMKAADLFVGKPGGLTSAECMAVGLPMVLVNPIPGQEVRNSDYLLEEGAAVRCNYRTTIGYKINELLREPGRLERMAQNARRIGRPDAAQTIAEAALRDDPRHFWMSHAAQKALAGYAERGVAVAPEGESRRAREELEELATLYDSAGGRSVGMVTAGEFAAMRRRMGSQMQGQTLALNEATLRALRRQSVDTGVVAFFSQVLGDAAETIVRLPAGLLQT